MDEDIFYVYYIPELDQIMLSFYEHRQVFHSHHVRRKTETFEVILLGRL